MSDLWKYTEACDGDYCMDGTARSVLGGRRMNRLDEAIANTGYILDSLRALREIRETGSCNECNIRKNCKVIPKCGEMVRYNCPFFVKEGE